MTAAVGVGGTRAAKGMLVRESGCGGGGYAK